MCEIGILLVEHQTIITLSTFSFGLLCLGILLKKRDGHVWKIVDLVWVVFGGGAAISAVIASIYINKDGVLARQVDVLKANMTSISTDARRFNEEHCSETSEIAFYASMVSTLCANNRVMIESITQEEQRPFFSEISDITEELREFAGKEISTQIEPLDDFLDPNTTGNNDPDIIKSIFTNADITIVLEGLKLDLLDPLNNSATSAISALRRSGLYFDMTADYTSIAREYQKITQQLANVGTAWELNQQDFQFVVARALAIALVAFAFPLRVGKSIHDLRKHT
jgi:hypothetical protein